MQKEIDLRSDTLTVPTREMLETMFRAAVGDDGRALDSKGEDPTAVETERYMAALFQKEDALFVPSGTMGNTLCVQTHCHRGSRIVTASNMHLYRAERVLFEPEFGGMKAVCVPQRNGIYEKDALKEALESEKIGLVCVENTYNFEGGRVLGCREMQSILELSHRYGVPVHVDGARIFNASLAAGVGVAELTKGADSVMFCVSKGLGAPVGSYIVGSAEFIRRAREIRKLIGGQLRQVGYLQAAGRYAVEHSEEQLLKDHRNAALFAELLEGCPGLILNRESVQTNIVMVYLCGGHAKEWISCLQKEEQVRAHYINDNSVRFVMFRGVEEADIREAAIRIWRYCKSRENMTKSYEIE